MDETASETTRCRQSPSGRAVLAQRVVAVVLLAVASQFCVAAGGKDSSERSAAGPSHTALSPLLPPTPPTEAEPGANAIEINSVEQSALDLLAFGPSAMGSSESAALMAVLQDFSGIAFVQPQPTAGGIANRKPAECSEDGGRVAPSSPETDYTATFAKRICISQTLYFAETVGRGDGGGGDGSGGLRASFHGDAIMRAWPEVSQASWEWMAEAAVHGPIANLACDVDSNSAMLQASALAGILPKAPQWHVLNFGLHDCLAASDGSNSPEATLANIKHTIETLRQSNCHSRVLLAAVLPATTDDSNLSWQDSPLRTCIQTTNALIKQHVSSLQDHQRVSYVDCGDRFLVSGGQSLDISLVPDGLIPSAKGYAAWGSCLAKAIEAQQPWADKVTVANKYVGDFNLGIRPIQPQGRAGWQFEAWGACTASCGMGVQTRNAHCVTLGADAGREVADSACDQMKLSILRTCQSSSCEANTWLAGPWSECTEPCSGGMAVRSTICVNQKGIKVDDSGCDDEARPSPTRVCNLQECHGGCGPSGNCSGHGQCVETPPSVHAVDSSSGSNAGRTTSLQCHCNPGWSGELCHVPDLCPSGVVVVEDGAAACCSSGVASTLTGRCCPSGSSLDGAGDCCPPGAAVDLCGVCGGAGVGLDVFGHCCQHQLDASGRCCFASRVDECGVCGGSGSSCDLVGMLSIQALSAIDMQVTVADILRPGFTGLLQPFGVEDGQVFIEELRAQPPSSGSEPPFYLGEVAFRIEPASQAGWSGFLSVARVQSTLPDLKSLPYASVTSLHGLRRQGHCGNNICELGEQSEDGGGGCPEDCPISPQACPVGTPSGGSPDQQAACSGRGRCTALIGVCDCLPGFSGPACESCAGGYYAVAGGACVPLPGAAPKGNNGLEAAYGASLSWAAGQEEGGDEGEDPPLVVVVFLAVAAGLLAVVVCAVAAFHVQVRRHTRLRAEARTVTFKTCKLYGIDEAEEDEEGPSCTETGIDIPPADEHSLGVSVAAAVQQASADGAAVMSHDSEHDRTSVCEQSLPCSRELTEVPQADNGGEDDGAHSESVAAVHEARCTNPSLPPRPHHRGKSPRHHLKPALATAMPGRRTQGFGSWDLSAPTPAPAGFGSWDAAELDDDPVTFFLGRSNISEDFFSPFDSEASWSVRNSEEAMLRGSAESAVSSVGHLPDAESPDVSIEQLADILLVRESVGR